MAMEWNKEFISKMIELYRNRPCLWKYGHKEYTNNTYRTKAYEEILSELKVYVPHANLSLLKAKIQNLRCSYRKELKKLTRLKRKGVDYTPRLWYFDLLHFTRNQNRLNTKTESLGYFIIEDKDVSKEELFQNETKDGDTQDPLRYDELVFIDASSRKTAQHAETFVSNDLSRSEVVPSTSNDDCGIFGTYVSQKLLKMNGHQQILAEALIQKIVTKGLKNQLYDCTTLVEKANDDEDDSAETGSQNDISTDFYEYTSNGLSRIK